MRILIANLVIALLAAGLPGCSTNANIPKAEIAQEPCGRDCLEGLAGQYLQSLAAQDPSRLPITDDFQLVENNQPLKPGEGIWRTVNGLGAYRHYFPDLQTGSVAAITVVKENGTLAILDLLLETENRRIRKAEVMIIRDPGGAARYEKLGEPLPIFRQTVPLENRTSRADMIAAANKYFSGMENNEPKGDYSFFADDCNRLEHALQTTNMPKQTYGHSDDSDFVTLTCKAQFETGFLGFVTRIRDRRFVAVDEERQALFAFTNLDHHGAIRSINMSNGKVFKVPSYFSTSRTLQVGEAFQIDKGKIRQIEMTLTEIPYGSRPGWPAADYNPATPPPAGPQPLAAGAGPCDRKCLGGLADQLLTAMVAHDASRAPLSP